MTVQTTEEPTTLSTLAGTSQVSYEELMGGAAVVEGYALTPKSDLLGHPFIITGVTFRFARMDKDGKGGQPLDYVSVEAVDLHSAAIIFNDGSTGVRRQVVQYLMAHGEVPEGEPDEALARVEGLDQRFTFRNGTNLPTLRCPRGLRVSEYENEYGEAMTYYLG
jgi:hypothetical protein